METGKLAKYTNLVLYSYWRSSCTWRVRIVLNIKKINYELKPINLLEGEHKKEDFLAINPMGYLPALMIDTTDQKNVILAESMAIIEFLEEEYPDIKMLPTDPIKRAIVRQICLEICSGIQPIQNLSILNKVAELGGDKTKWAKEAIVKGFTAVETILSKTRGKYCVGDNVSFADAFLIPQIYNARRFNIEMENYPNIVDIEKNLLLIEEFIQASPENQPDKQ